MQATFGWRLPWLYRLQVMGTVGVMSVVGVVLPAAGAAPAWFAVLWVAVLCWNGYWFLLRIVYQLEVRGGVLWWWAPLRAGQVPIGEVVAIRPSRVAVMGHVVTTRRGTIWVGLTRFDGHPPSGALPRGGCPSWRPWNASSLVRAGRSRLSSRPRSSSCASAVTARWGGSPATST